MQGVRQFEQVALTETPAGGDCVKTHLVPEQDLGRITVSMTKYE
jgi:hypothetical protein